MSSSEVHREGWTFLIEEDRRVQAAQIRLIVRGGSLQDPVGKEGLSHVLARLLLRGTQSHPQNRWIQSLEALGGAIDIEACPEETEFSGVVLTENLGTFLALWAEMLCEPEWAPEEIAIVTKQINGELSTRLQEPRVLVATASMDRIYAGTRASFPSEGRMDSVLKITRDDLIRSHSSRFVRENMLVGLLVPAGESERWMSEWSRLFARVPRGTKIDSVLPLPTLQGRRAWVVPQAGLTTIPFLATVSGVGEQDPWREGLSIANFVFGADFTSKLMQVLRNQNGWAYGAYSGFAQIIDPSRESGLFSLYSFPSVEFGALAIPKAIELLDEFVARGITEDELSKARTALIRRYPFSIDSAEKRIDLRIDEALTGRRYLTAAEYAAMVQPVELSELNRTVAQKLTTKDLSLVVAGDYDMLAPILMKIPGITTVETIEVAP